MAESEWLRGDWMQTQSGAKFYPLDPRPEEVHIEDIAHALGMLCRYAGHVDRFYSVAEHCVHVSDWLLAETGDRDLALGGLLHDATEAYVVDVPRPLKVHLPDYREAENRVAAAIELRFGVNSDDTRIKEADTRILLDERTALMSKTKHEWGVDSLRPLDVHIRAAVPRRATELYLRRFRALAPETKEQ